MKGRLGWIVAVALLGVILYLLWHRDGGNDLLAAAAAGKVTVAASADRPDRAHVVVIRSSGGSEPLTYTLNAGSLIVPGDDRTQRLMIAETVEIRFGAGETRRDVDVRTYCLDQFKPPPLETTVMTFSSPGDAAIADTSEYAKLADCLQQGSAMLRRRQVALWLVKGGFLDKSYDDATGEATRQFEEELSTELQEKIDSEFAARLRRSVPGISDAEVQRQIDRFTPDKLRARVHDKAVAMTQGAFGHAKADAQQLLEQCGYRAATALFFQTAPDG